MVEKRSTGRDQEIVEVAPSMLACGHPYGPGLVTIGFELHPERPTRVRTYRCRECATVTYTDPD